MYDPHTRYSDENPYRTATAKTDATQPKGPSRAAAWARALLSPHGRIPRSHWWACQIGWYSLVLTLVWYVDEHVVPEGVLTATLAVLFWPVLANHIKRWHDIGKPAWCCLLLLLPFFGLLFTTIELGLQRGTAGPNLYGEDPLQ